MNNIKDKLPVYLIMGFLDGGKSTFLNDTIQQEYFRIQEPTLLLCCEEGEVEYDNAGLLACNTFLEILDDADSLTAEKLKALQKKYNPGRVLVECNVFWKTNEVLKQILPDDWEIIQQIMTVDGSTFDVFMKNMKSHFMDMARSADTVIFNRCKQEQPLAGYRRSIKVANPEVEILFEESPGKLIDIFNGGLPYDMDADIIEIDDTDYGIFYVDVQDNCKKYKGKKVKFKGRVLKSKKPGADFFVPARMAMTCCADDTAFIGYVCKSSEAKNLEMGEWVELTAEIRWEWLSEYKKKGPVLYASKIEKTTAPQTDLVYFN